MVHTSAAVVAEYYYRLLDLYRKLYIAFCRLTVTTRITLCLLTDTVRVHILWSLLPVVLGNPDWRGLFMQEGRSA
jgi:hypothetical protein